MQRTFFFIIYLMTTVASFSEPAQAQDTATEICPVDAVLQATLPMRPYKSVLITRGRSKIMREPKDAEIILFGDSIVDGWVMEPLEEMVAPQRILNLGVGGDRTQQVIWRLNMMDMSQYNPRKVVLMIGTNNLGDREPACGIAEGIKVIVERIDTYWPNADIIVIETLPRGVNFSSYSETRLPTFDLLRTITDTPLTLLNVDEAITCGIDAFPEEWFETRRNEGRAPSPCENYRDDLLHIEAPGYDVLNTALAPLLTE